METENMSDTKRVEVMDSMLDWELMLDSRVDGETRVLEELEVSFRDPDKVFTTEEEELNVSLLLELIGQTEYTEKATRCLCLLVRYKLRDNLKMTFIGDRLYDLFSNQETMTIALKAIKTLIVEMPALDLLYNEFSRSVELGRRLVESLAPRIVIGVNKNNVTESFDLMGMLIRHFGSIMRNHTKLCNMRFLGEHYFCTGVELGKGAFATVYLGRDTKTAAVVAIKTMEWNRLTNGRDKVRIALENEIRIMREADHPNIVKLHDALREGCYLHLILEYCGGGSLEEYLLKRGRLSEEETIHWLHELALGLRFLRENSLVHRDLKPGNLLLSVETPTASLKITDFTFARFLESGDLATSFVGTPLYMAPEIFGVDKAGYTEKSDLWSVGVLIYQMLTATLPYRGDNFQDLLLNIAKNELKWPDDLKVSADIKDLVRCLLQKQPDLRISWTEFFMHPCLRLIGGHEEEDEEPAALDESVIVTTDPMIQSVIVTKDPEAALKAATAEVEALKKELKEVKEELVITKERLAHSEEEKEDYAARYLMADFSREQGEQKGNDELERLRAEKIKSDAEIDRLKNQVLLIATSKIKECSTEELDTLRSENTSLKETVESLTKELEVYKVALQLEAADAGVSSSAWKKYFS